MSAQESRVKATSITTHHHEAGPGVGDLATRSTRYLGCDAEIDALLAAALALPPANGLRRWTYHGLFGLIAVTGMHLSEAIGLRTWR